MKKRLLINSVLGAAIFFNTLYLAAQVCFTPPVHINSGKNEVHSADLNGDGKIDLISSAFGSNVIVNLGNGDGTFGMANVFSSNSASYKIASADFDGDGDVDLAVTNDDVNGTVSILLNNGSGSFGSPTAIAVGSNPESIIVGDFNDDGDPDLAVVSFNSPFQSVTILLGSTGSTFVAAPTLTGGGFSAITVADFNGDNKLDIATTKKTDDLVYVFLGNGDGTFASAFTFSSNGDNPISITNGDYNNDGFVDIVVGHDGASGPTTTTCLFLGNGTGAYGTFSAFATYTYNSSLFSVDFNGDGHLDLAGAGKSGFSTVNVYLGNGLGNFDSHMFVVNNSTFLTQAITVADFNGDSKLDIATANGTNTNSNAIILNTIVPVINANGSDLEVCEGNSVTLFGSGDGTSYTWNNGVTDNVPYYPSSTSDYIVTGYDANGCKNVDTITITVNQPSYGMVIETACGSFTLNSQTYTETGVYPQNLINKHGCDSNLTVDITIINVDTSLIVDNLIITANATGAAYQWLDCDNAFAIISDETAQSYTATANGNYAVEITQNSCVDTSSCVSIVSVGTIENSFSRRINLFPNPTTSISTLLLSNSTKNAQLSIVDITGKEVYFMNDIKSDKVNLNLTKLNKGIYFVKVILNEKQEVIKLIKE
ncbi:MAG: T9SS type A sorting domain-containing protein [Flavobacteriales bacterium]|nr:T9SS type A sorting domain-containing protein [Flavobacteriales bacterium]